MGTALRHAGHDGQGRLFAIERLHVRLFIDVEHERAVERGQMEADNVTDLIDKKPLPRPHQRRTSIASIISDATFYASITAATAKSVIISVAFRRYSGAHYLEIEDGDILSTKDDQILTI